MKEWEELVTAHLDLVRPALRRLNPGYSLTWDDLMSWGTIGLIKAARTYDPERSVPFAAYARMRIQAEAVDALRREYGRGRYYRPAPVSLDECHWLAREEFNDRIHDRIDLRRNLTKLTPREGRLVQMVYQQGIPIETIAGQSGISAGRVHQIHHRALNRLREHMGVQTQMAPIEEIRLTQREQEVAVLLCEGLSNAEIGQRLNLSGKTIQTHLANIYSKLGVSSRLEVVAYLLNRCIAELEREVASLRERLTTQ